MIFKNFKIESYPYLHNVQCPGCVIEMLELPDGFFSKCWYCAKCKSLYTLKLSKIRKYDKKVLKELLKGVQETRL